MCRFYTRGNVHTESWRPKGNYLHEHFLGLHFFTRMISFSTQVPRVLHEHFLGLHFFTQMVSFSTQVSRGYTGGKIQHTSLPRCTRYTRYTNYRKRMDREKGLHGYMQYLNLLHHLFWGTLIIYILIISFTISRIY